MILYIFKSKRLFLSYLAIVIYLIFPVNSYSQEDLSDKDIRFLPAVALNEVVQYSDAKIMSNYIHQGIVSGVKGDDTIYIKDVYSLDTCIVETKDYDKILFFWDYVEKTTKTHKTQYWYFNVNPKKEFDLIISPIKEIEMGNLMVFNSQDLKKVFAEQKLYEIKITDEVNQDQIIVTPFEDAKPFIDVWKIDSGTTYAAYHIKLKNKEEFNRNLSEEDKAKWNKGEEVKFPIGIQIIDKNIPSYFREYNLFLVKKKSTKKKTS